MYRLFFTCLFTLFLTIGYSQITLPPSGGNQKAVVTQYIGPLAQVTVRYSSPDVTGPNGEDRKGQIWGQLVHYGFIQQGFGLNKPAPWRAGANECTVIEFSHDVEIEGKPLKAGKYGFFIAVAEEGPWTIIFSKNTSGWGSYFYDEKDDVLRVEVLPKESEYHEWLTYEFIDRQQNTATLAMKWEAVSLPFKIEVPDNNELIVENLKAELQGDKGFTWTNFNAAAAFCLQNDVALEQGLQWADQSINDPFFGATNFTTLSTKAQLLDKTGKPEAAASLMEEAIKHPSATIPQVYNYGRSLLAQGKKEKALEVFEYNKEHFGDVWPVRVGLARALSALGKYEEALEHAQIAYERAPNKPNKDFLAQAIEKLKNKQDIN